MNTYLIIHEENGKEELTYLPAKSRVEAYQKAKEMGLKPKNVITPLQLHQSSVKTLRKLYNLSYVRPHVRKE